MIQPYDAAGGRLPTDPTDIPSLSWIAVEAWREVKGDKPLPVLGDAAKYMSPEVKDWSSLMGFSTPQAYAILMWGKELPEMFGVPMAGQEAAQFVNQVTYQRLAGIHHVIDNFRCGAVLKLRGRGQGCGDVSKTVTVLPFTHQNQRAAMWYGRSASGEPLHTGRLNQVIAVDSVRWIDLGTGAPGVPAQPKVTVH